MKSLVKPSAVSGTIAAPPSKSIAQRAIALALLVKGESIIENAGNSDDVLAAIHVCRALGAKITEHNDKLTITGGIKNPSTALNCGESGLGIRMFSPIVASLDCPVTLTGSGTLTQRPMVIVEEAIKAMGAKCSTTSGFMPITVEGPLVGGEAKVDGSLSSQVLTGMLMAAPLAKSDVIISVSNLQSKPYIDITVETMKAFGVDVENDSYEVFRVKSGQIYQPTQIMVEGDWSGAAFMLVAGAIAGSVKVESLNPMSKQADRAIIQALIWAGASVSVQDKFIEVGNNELNSFHFDASHCPDLFPPLVALAAHCKGETRILGVSRLRAKESNRGETLQQEFGKLGISIKIEGDLMTVSGGTVNGGKVQSHGDHRIAMACAVAALAGNGEIEIEKAEAVGKSYPVFFEDLIAVKSSINSI
jgi:3-phosphoshikimate 1-carboxyvinyltransferase